MSCLGLNLLLNLALPIAFATIAQMCVITVNDLDLGIGAFVGLVACIGATWLNGTPFSAWRRWPAASPSMPGWAR